MHMAIHHVLWPPSCQQIIEAGKTTVGRILSIPKAKTWGVAHKQIKASCKPEHAFQMPDALMHLLFRIHIFTVMIAHGSAQSQNPQAMKVINCIININTAQRRMMIIERIVIAAHIQQRNIGYGGKKLQIIR